MAALSAAVSWVPALGQSGHWPAELHAALAGTGIPRESVALYVHEVGAEAPVLVWNADRSMNPASTMKLVTTLAALERLGPTYTWRTEAYVHGRLEGGVLAGDLVLKGRGDPKLTLENFWLLLADLRTRGLREIRGNLVLDRSAFALAAADPAEFDDQPARPYNVEPDALLINYKSIRLQLVPDEQHGRVDIFATPALPEVSILNQLALAPGNCNVWPDRPQVVLDPPRLVFTGVFPAGCGERTRNFALLDRDRYAQSIFSQTWRALGGVFDGTARPGRLPPEATLLATWQSPPLAEVIRDINKFSNNVMARNLFLTLALEADAESAATTSAAAQVTQDWLRSAGIDAPELVLDNGSGLSRGERIGARALGQVLMRGFEGPLMPEYVASLPIVGVDGTLRRRLSDSPAAGQAHIKTGYLDSVRAIAGYVRDRGGRWFVVVALINHPAAANATGLQDAVIDWTYLRAGTARACCRRCTPCGK